MVITFNNIKIIRNDDNCLQLKSLRFWWRNEGKEAPWRLSFESDPSALF